MGSEWTKTNFEAIAAPEPNALTGGPFGSNLGRKDYRDIGVPVIRGANIASDGHFIFDDFVFVDEEKAKELKSCEAFPGDIIVTQRGTLGQVSRIPFNGPFDRFIVSQSQMRLKCDPSKVDPDFVYYYLRSPLMEQYISSRTIVTGVPHINLTILREAPIEYPSIESQRRIANILGTLDDKIDLNRRMNRTLEAMARALFKSWFVDFDPVRAKQRGEAPVGVDAETAALFPERLVDSELGEIPEGWEVKRLDEVIEILTGGTPKTKIAEYWNGDIPWFSVKDAPSESDVFVVQTDRTITPQGIENSSAKIMPANTTIITARGTVGKLALTAQEMAMNQSCYGIRGADGIGDYFTYYCVHSTIRRLQQRTHGTVFDTIKKKTFSTIKIAAPPVKLTREYDRVVAPLLERIRLNLHENLSLAEMRDVLLPELLGGGI